MKHRINVQFRHGNLSEIQKKKIYLFLLSFNLHFDAKQKQVIIYAVAIIHYTYHTFRKFNTSSHFLQVPISRITIKNNGDIIHFIACYFYIYKPTHLNG